MPAYVIKNYQPGFEHAQASIGAAVARNWLWPYAYDLDDLQKAFARPGFDPATHFYCFQGDEFVGYMFASVTNSGDACGSSATVEFPRMLHGHERAAPQLLEWACQALAGQGITRLTGRVTTMAPADIRIADDAGFTIYDWGYKLYYTYEMGWGNLDLPLEPAEEIDPTTDLAACAALAALWYKRPADWCLETLQGWHAYGIIAHLGVRLAGKWIAACLTAPNFIRPTTVANYYIYTPDADCLRRLLASAVDKCIRHGAGNLIADLVNDHRPFEPVYQELGFKKVAEWARCEKLLQPAA